MCTLALKEVVKYYTSRKGQVYCCLLDATKAFDRVRFDKLFSILQTRGLPNGVIRLLMDMYRRQKVRTTWGGSHSSTFTTINGVRQGGVLSPILFAIYIDVLLDRLESSGIGCYVGDEYMGALGSADDLSLLAPTLYSLKCMIRICEDFATEYDIAFNGTKTVCMWFHGRRTAPVRDMPVITLGNTPLSWSNTAKHLGNIISSDITDGDEIRAKRSDFIGRVNSAIANFKYVPRDICSRVFVSQCCHLYGSQAWAIDNNHIETFCVSWNRAVRKLWFLPNTARSCILPYLVGTKSIRQQILSRVASLYNSIRKGHNRKMLNLMRHSVNMNNMGIMGRNTEVISNEWHCGFEKLVDNTQSADTDMAARAAVIRDLTDCREGRRDIAEFSRDEVADLRNYVACYRD